MRSACPACGFVWSWTLGDGRRKCRRCGRRYTPARSAWSSVHVSAQDKRQLLEYFVLGVPVYRARFRLRVSRPTAEKFFRHLRTLLAQAEENVEPFDGQVEIDETTFGGARKGGKRGWGAPGKVIVLGILKRNGKVKVWPVPDRKWQRLRPLIEAQTKPGSLYFTDEYQAYATLAIRGGHVVVRKQEGRPKGRDTINGIEGFWSYAKNWLYQYRGVPKKFFPLYLGEVSYRFNHRNEDLLPLIEALLRKSPKRKPD